MYLETRDKSDDLKKKKKKTCTEFSETFRELEHMTHPDPGKLGSRIRTAAKEQTVDFARKVEARRGVP